MRKPFKALALSLESVGEEGATYRVFTGELRFKRGGGWKLTRMVPVSEPIVHQFIQFGQGGEHAPALRKLEREWSEKLGLPMAHSASHCECKPCQNEAREAAAARATAACPAS